MNKREELWSVLKSQKTPLTLAVVAQASNIGIWMINSGKTNLSWYNLAIGIIGAFSIDLIIVSTAFGKKQSKKAWAMAVLTSIIALIFGVAIALYLYKSIEWSAWDTLHAAFPILVFFYSWFLSVTKADEERLKEQKLKEIKERAALKRQFDLEKIPQTTQAYRRKIIVALLELHLSKNQIFKIVGGKAETTLALIDEIVHSNAESILGQPESILSQDG